MAVNLLDHKLRKHFATIDELVTELLIIRRYIYSAKIGLTHCREHVTRGLAAGNLSCSVESEFIKCQEQLLIGLRQVEKKIKKRLEDASKELAFTCRRERELG